MGFKIGPFSAIDVYGTPFTQALHVVGRYRLIDYEAARAAWERGGRENSRAGQGIGESSCDLAHRAGARIAALDFDEGRAAAVGSGLALSLRRFQELLLVFGQTLRFPELDHRGDFFLRHKRSVQSVHARRT